MNHAWHKALICVLLAGVLASCSPAEPTIDVVPLAPTATFEQATQVATMVEAAESTPTRIPTATIVPTLAPIAVNAEPLVLNCMPTFEKREMKEPYQRNKSNDARYTLSTEELQALFQRMGIKNLCIPVDLGAPFINADWDSAAQPATKGRMISLGFEGLYRGAGWSDGFIVAATYDFAAPTEYDTFATPEDIGALRNGKLPNRAIRTFEANGITGFQRVAAGMGMGLTPLYMTYVIPFEQGYVAVIYSLGNYEGDLQPIMDKLSRGGYPEGAAKMVRVFEAIAKSVEK